MGISAYSKELYSLGLSVTFCPLKESVGSIGKNLTVITNSHDILFFSITFIISQYTSI